MPCAKPPTPCPNPKRKNKAEHTLNATPIHVLGIGSPLIDLIVKVDDAFLANVPGEKGGMQWMTPEEQKAIIRNAGGAVEKAAAGSASNTLYALARLGLESSFCGMTGNDADGAEYREQLEKAGEDISRLLDHPTEATGTCLAIVTPDGERTMRSHLGAALCLSEDNIPENVFEGITHLHLEGYLLCNRPLFRKVLEMAYDAECTVSLDLASFEVVRENKEILETLLPEYVNIVFANDDEAKAFADGETSWEAGFEKLASLCQTVCVKRGALGAVVRSVDETVEIPAVPVQKVVDATSAGDLWAAGFLYGYLQNHPLADCGKYGAILSSAVIQVAGTGASLSDDAWETLLEQIA